MSGVGVQDFTPVVIGKRTRNGSGFAGGSDGQASDKKQAGVVGIGGKLESGAARKLDDNETKAPDTVGREVGKVSLFDVCSIYLRLQRLMSDIFTGYPDCS